MTQGEAIEYIGENPGAKMTEVAEALGARINTASTILGKLHSRGRLVRVSGNGTRHDPYRYDLAERVRVKFSPVNHPELPKVTHCHPDVQRRIIHRLRDMRGRDVTLRMLKHYVRAESTEQLHDAAEDLVAQGVLKRGDEVMTWRYW